jgi:uncharacterized membrane protein
MFWTWYIIICLVWGVFAFLKTRYSYNRPLNNYYNCFKSGIINTLLMPICIGVWLVKLLGKTGVGCYIGLHQYRDSYSTKGVIGLKSRRCIHCGR